MNFFQTLELKNEEYESQTSQKHQKRIVEIRHGLKRDKLKISLHREF